MELQNKIAIVSCVLLQFATMKLGTAQSTAEIFQKQPKNISVEIRTNEVIMDCIFNYATICVWKLNGDRINTSETEKYEYVKEIADEGTTDCSLKIKNISKSFFIFPTKWRCLDKNDKTKKSRFGWLTVIEFVSGPSNLNVFVDAEVKLPCVLSTNVSCSWYRNNEALVVKHNYSYIDGNNGSFTQDCTLKIQKVKSIDETTWQCEAQSNDGSGFVLTSPKAKIYLIDKKVSEHPKNQTVTLGSSAILYCKFNADVTCSWTRNDDTVGIRDRYRYIKANAEKKEVDDCSINISGITNSDLHKWKCSAKGTDSQGALESKEAWLTLKEQECAVTILRQGKYVKKWMTHWGGGLSNMTCKLEPSTNSANLTWELDRSDVLQDNKHNRSFRNVSLRHIKLQSQKINWNTFIQYLACIAKSDQCTARTELTVVNLGFFTAVTVTFLFLLTLTTIACVAVKKHSRKKNVKKETRIFKSAEQRMAITENSRNKSPGEILMQRRIPSIHNRSPYPCMHDGTGIAKRAKCPPVDLWIKRRSPIYAEIQFNVIDNKPVLRRERDKNVEYAQIIFDQQSPNELGIV